MKKVISVILIVLIVLFSFVACKSNNSSSKEIYSDDMTETINVDELLDELIEEDTTVAETTILPTTEEPTTIAPTTVVPTTVAPTTVAPTTVVPTTIAPTTVVPTTVAPTTKPSPTQKPPQKSVVPAYTKDPTNVYILNTNTHKFHLPSCSSVSKIKKENKQEFIGTRQQVLNQGFEPCQRCSP